MFRTYLRWAILLAAVPSLGQAADDPGSKFVDIDGVKVHYFDQGKGEPVVLIHGMHSGALLNWKLPGVIDALAKDHRVIAIDLPGHGQSDKPEKEEAYGLKIVDDVLKLMDHLKIEKAHIVGYSLGGMVTVKFLVLHPDRAISGTLGGMGWFRDESLLQKMWDKVPAKGVLTPAAFVKTIGKLAVTEEDVKKIKVPVEVIVGDHDPMKALFVEPLKPVRPDWSVVEIKDAGHINCVMKPQFKEALVEWVKKNSK
jgi:pimeloyl-ACP methyl ester carboxylesterase